MRLLPKIEYVSHGHEDIYIVPIEDSKDFMVRFGTYDWTDDTCRVLYTPDVWLQLEWILHEFVHGLIIRIPFIRLRLLLDWWWDNRGEYYICDWSTFRWVWEEFTTWTGPFPWFAPPDILSGDIWEEFKKRRIKVYGPIVKEEDLNTGDEIEE